MKKAICILNAYKILAPLQHFADRMKEEFKAFDIELIIKNNSELFSFLDNHLNYTPLKEKYLFGLYLDKDTHVAKALEHNGLRLFNSEEAIRLCDDKALTYEALVGTNINVPKNIFGPLNYSQNISLPFIERVEEELKYPLVGKEVYGSMGNNVYLLKNRKEFEEFEFIHRYNPRIYQEFIETSYGVDYRLIVIGGKFVAAMKRVNNNGDFRSNLARGGRGLPFNPPLSYIETAEKVCRALKLDYAGVDLLEGRNKEPVLSEVNSNAFVTGIEETTDINVCRLYAEYIVKTLGL